jgi:hypothetical protein
MRYLLVVYSDETPPGADDPLDGAEESTACERSLRDSGRVLMLESLHAADTATTVRLRHGRLLIEDGPCTAHSGRIRGIWVISAKDYNDAVRIAAQLPAARSGWIEVRAVRVAAESRAPVAAD